MPAKTPEEIHALIEAAFNAGDLDAFVELHEPDAVSVVPPTGEVARGKDQIRAALEPILAQSRQSRSKWSASWKPTVSRSRMHA